MDKFWEKVNKLGPNDCWEWGGYIEQDGYGRLSYKGERHWLAHRVAWLLTNGEIPEGMCVLHECDNPPCVNPNHLFLGTYADNAADRDNKGRGKLPGIKGEQHWRSKLTVEDVIEIRSMLSNGCKLAHVAGIFDIAQSTASQIKTRQRWAHVD